MEFDSNWIYLLMFLGIPLAKMIPRYLKKRKNNQNNNTSQRIQEKIQIRPDNSDNNHSNESQMGSSFSSKLSEKNMLVLGELVRGSNTFDSLQKNTGLGNKELDEILENLEKEDMLKVHQKKSITGGAKIQLHPTDKGLQKYYSS